MTDNCMEVVPKSWPTFMIINCILKSCIMMYSCFSLFLLGHGSPQEYIHIHFLCGTALSEILLWFYRCQHDLSLLNVPIFCVRLPYHFGYKMIWKCILHSLIYRPHIWWKWYWWLNRNTIMSSYPTVHIIIFKPVSNLLASSGKCSFNSLKALGISSAGRNANSDKWHICKMNFSPLPYCMASPLLWIFCPMQMKIITR